MRHFQDESAFNEEMKTVKQILERKGYVLESDHVYAKTTKLRDAFEDIKDWLLDNGYEGKLDNIGNCYGGIAVYGLYDPSRVSLETMKKKTLAEAKAEYNM